MNLYPVSSYSIHGNSWLIVTVFPLAGVLLHYDDVNLSDIYFLDPQWLCDVLANVVTIREINSLAKCGIMRTDDLKILFKNAAFKPEDIKTYVIDLLNKFEVALMWDERNLLIPSLLPTEDDINRGRPHSDIRVSCFILFELWNKRQRPKHRCLLQSLVFLI